MGIFMKRLLLVPFAALLAAPLFAAHAALPETNAVLTGAAFIKSTQAPDGSYGTDSLGQNMDAVFAVRAAGYNPAKDQLDGKGPADFLIANVSAVDTAAAASKAAMGAKALGLDPKSVGGVDLIASVSQNLEAADSSYLGDDFSQSIALLGLACTGNAVPAKAVAALQATVISDGGGWGFGGVADPDITAITIQALLASGVAANDAHVQAGLAYLKAHQGSDGGWGFDPTASNANSTAYVVQALLALGENPDSASYEKDGVTPVEFMLSQQQADGSFAGFDPAYATNQVLPALAGRTYCNAVDTPITRTRPVVEPTPTAGHTQAPASPTTAPPTVAPKPPSTGTGGGSTPANSYGASSALGIAFIVTAGGLALAWAGRKNR